ncbi:MAG TPA: hypothetical protein VFT74_13440 [Isosphaeraceae bacterium]|nr:hypothetical protein [Isosphaeraceae bacterium]
MKWLKLPSGSYLNLSAAVSVDRHGLDGSLAVVFVGSAAVLKAQDAEALRRYLQENAEVLPAGAAPLSLADAAAGRA